MRPAALAAAARRLLHDRTGTAGLEFAAAGLVILILLLAIFDIGLLFLSQRGLDFAVARTARWASTHSAVVTPASVLAQFQAATTATLGSANQACLGLAVTATVPPGTRCYVTLGLSNGAQPGSLVTIHASYGWTPVSAVTGLVAATLQSSAALTIQN